MMTSNNSTRTSLGFDALEGKLLAMQSWMGGFSTYLCKRLALPYVNGVQFTERLGTVQAEALHKSLTYTLTPDIFDLLTTSIKENIPSLALNDLSLPSEEGWLWFQDPFHIALSQDDFSGRVCEVNVSALSWYWSTSPEGRLMLEVVTYADLRAIAIAEGYSHLQVKEIIPSLVIGWDAEASARSNGVQGIYLARDRHPVMQHLTNEQVEDLIWQLCSLVCTLLSALFLFLEQPLLTETEEIQAPRSIRRSYQKSIKDIASPIRIIQLRSMPDHPHSYSDSERHYDNVRWIVSGHWRNQYYPSMKTHRPKYIPSYVKGPEGKPLKTRPIQIFEVSR